MLPLQSGIAGGADVILLPEIPYDIDKVAEVVENRFAVGKKFSIIAVAEGAISKEDAKLKKKQYKAKLAERRYPSVAYEIAAALEEKKQNVRSESPFQDIHSVVVLLVLTTVYLLQELEHMPLN